MVAIKVRVCAGLLLTERTVNRFTSQQNLISSASLELTSPILIEGEIAAIAERGCYLDND